MAEELTKDMDNLNLDEQNRAKFDTLPTRIKEQIYNESFGMLGESKLKIKDLQADRRVQVDEVVSHTDKAMRLYNSAIEEFDYVGNDLAIRGIINAARFNDAFANKARENVNELTEDINRLSQLYYFHYMNKRYRFDKER